MARHFARELNFVLGAEKNRVGGSNWFKAADPNLAEKRHFAMAEYLASRNAMVEIVPHLGQRCLTGEAF